MKKPNAVYMIIGLITLTTAVTLSSIYLISKFNNKPKLSPLDSRNRMTADDFVDRGGLYSGAQDPSAIAIENIQKNQPYKNESFSLTWNQETNNADVVLYQPYDVSMANLLSWLGSISASNYQAGTLNITKQ